MRELLPRVRYRRVPSYCRGFLASRRAVNCGGQVRGSLLSLEFIDPYVVIPSLRILYEALLIVAAVGIQWVYALGDDIDIGNTRPPIDNTCV